MGRLADQLDRMRVSADIARGAVVARVDGRTRVSLSFLPGVYQRADESELARELTNLAKLLWAARTREYYAIVSDVTGETRTQEAHAVNQRDVDFFAARDELVAEGRSFDDRIQITVQGMRSFRVRIAPGTLRTLTEEEFAERAGEAGSELVRDQLRKVRELKLMIYEDRPASDFE